MHTLWFYFILYIYSYTNIRQNNVAYIFILGKTVLTYIETMLHELRRIKKRLDGVEAALEAPENSQEESERKGV